jgi:hypothetical protein
LVANQAAPIALGPGGAGTAGVARVGYRFCHYMIAHKPRMKGKWAFGQFAPMMTAEELKLVFEKVKAKGWME